MTIQILVLLLFVMAVAAFVADRLKIPPSILLVLTGVGLALTPGLPEVTLAPEVLLLLVLPPVIYSSAVAMSWREFRFNLRPISLLAVGCVVFTTAAVAWATHMFLNLPWPVGFVLGAIVSPPDAVAPLSIVRRLQIPRRLAVILEGEGLANDATALILYRFAVVAVSAGAFSFGRAATTFAAIVIGEVIWGVVVGWGMLRLRGLMQQTRIEILLSLLTPFIAYWPPEILGGSGVLATMVAGLYISWNGLRLISAATRLQGIFFWSFLVYVIEGLVFLITGLQARALIERIHGYSISALVVSAAIVCGVVIVARFIWMYPATYLPRWLIPAVRRRDPAPPWQWPFALAFTGIRGIVSLAAALAIPLTIGSGAPFPHRDLIIFLTFSVILVTLVGQGLLLPLVLRALGLANAGQREAEADRLEEFVARRQGAEAAARRLEKLAAERTLSEDFLYALRARNRDQLLQIETRSDEADDSRRKLAELHDDVEFDLIATERTFINELYRSGELKDEARRRIEYELDLREADLSNQRGDA
ncbi:MAG TPA: Na+/H+ antiporter [Rhizomicrobium sp.]